MSKGPVAEQLIAIAAAHGVDLLQAARVAAGKKPTHRMKSFKSADGDRSTVLLEPLPNAVRGKATRVYKRPQYTVAELGIGLAGVPNPHAWAAYYAFAGARGYFERLRLALESEANTMRLKQEWPAVVRDIHGLPRPYLPWLAKLILDEDFCPNEFRVCPQLYAWYLQIPERTWEREICQRYLQLRFVWLRWLGTAASMVQAKLSDEPVKN